MTTLLYTSSGGLHLDPECSYIKTPPVAIETEDTPLAIWARLWAYSILGWQVGDEPTPHTVIKNTILRPRLGCLRCLEPVAIKEGWIAPFAKLDGRQPDLSGIAFPFWPWEDLGEEEG